ncbi:glycosyl hydrolase family 18 protein [Paenibacillus sp. 481]|uniref:glycosyl hydrolase family 18 protein n=1 Tax=Paenibacillus sp. 481 TaxID=2835869 RepID=UPI001E2F7DD5|nr:glycosyl hydrolase family 18 protein [Paenibacillus sp. 481]UHA75502.1 chitinase C-terminal domain-containing protein [Paenibacillus sp. 481]
MFIFSLIFTLILSSISFAPAVANAATKVCSAAWSAAKVYTGGHTASENGQEWRAKWWTQGEKPGTSGVWENLGPCSSTNPGNQAPSVPANLTVTGTTYTSVSLTWGASTDDKQVAEYVLSYNGAEQNVAATNATVAGLTPNTKYTFTVKAKDNEGLLSAASNIVEATTGQTPLPGNQPPTAPTTLALTAKTANSVSLTWAASSDDKQVAGYTVYYNGAVQTAVGTTVTVAGLNPNTKYTFTVKAKDSEGLESAASNILDVTTEAGVVDPNDACRPEGLYNSGVKGIPYCNVYDQEGREKLANDSKRRIIGYFTSWRTGKNNQPKYLASDIPWKQMTHINYAFAHINGSNQVSVGSATASNPALGLTWPEYPEAAMDPTLPYKGHLNQLNKFKKQNPGVKTLVSIGGWAETGGYFDDAGNRVANGGFYSMTTNADGTINHAGINTFADSVVQFLRQYNFDGADIDYEYPTTMQKAGNPLDWNYSTPRLKGLVASYDELMKTLRVKLDQASAQDGKYYYLTIASPSSGYLLRGMETFQALKYLDYVNIMSYDLHGAWNEFVGPNAALFDDGNDAELKKAGIYSTAQYGGIGYLNTDWAYHYMRGLMQAGRINIGVPYYTRGFQNVTGGTNGLWGTAVGKNCPTGLTACGDGAVGIDNIWHDKDEQGRELGAGSNPLWHTMNLEKGIKGSYLNMYGLQNAPLTGTYGRHYDATLVAPWLWNPQKRVYLSTEDEQSMAAKADYVVKNGIGGIMIWELAGDYDFHQQRNNGKGEYFIGSTLTRLIHSKFVAATPYGNKNSATPLPVDKLDVKVQFTGFKLGDQNYPINPIMRVTNNSAVPIKGGSVIEFDVPTSSPAIFNSWSGDDVKVISTGHTGNNVGGLKGDFHRVAVKLSAWKSIAPGATEDFSLVYYVPISGPTNLTLTIDAKKYTIN